MTVVELPERIEPSRLGRGELIKAARERGLSVVGTTVELIERVNAWQAEHLPPVVEVDGDDDGDDLGLDDIADVREAPAVRAPAAVTQPPVSHPFRDDVITVGRDEWEAMRAQMAELTRKASAGDVAKPLDLPAAGMVVGKQKVGLFPSGYRVEHLVGPRPIDDVSHFQLLEDTHNRAREAGYRTKGAPYAGLRVGYAADDRGNRTAIYEVSVHLED